MSDVSSGVMPDQQVRSVTVDDSFTGSGRVAAQVSLALAWLVMLGVTALWVSGGGIQEVFSSPTGFFTSLGRLAGLLASAALLIQLVMMSRVPWLEQAWGQDELARGHRLVGLTSFTGMLVHIALITIGYAAAQPAQLWSTAVDLTLNYPGMLLAVAGTVALCLVVFTSIRAARRRLRYESWHLIHLYGYLGAGLVLPHQLWTGQNFLTSPVATVFWWGLWGLTAALFLTFRIALPRWRSWRADLRVLATYPDGPGVVSVVVGGRGVRHLRARGGQFFQWRFLDGPGWTRANPFSLSAAPRPDSLRFTAAVVGDGTARLTALRPGTKVLIEGPYGRLHPGARTRRDVLLIGAGVGFTPLRALLEAWPYDGGAVTIVQRARSEAEAVLAGEINELAAHRGAQHYLLLGHRIAGRDSWQPASRAGWSDVDALRAVCPDIASRDVFVCGPGPWTNAVLRAVREAGVPAPQVHSERFEI